MPRWLLCLMLSPALAAGADLTRVIEQVRGAYQSEEAMRVMRDVYANDRYFTFPRFHATAEYLRLEQHKCRHKLPMQ